MSRGLGKLQTSILEKLKEKDCFYLIELLPREYSLKQYQATHRAAVSLSKKGILKIQCWKFGRNRVAVARINFVQPSNDRLRFDILKDTYHSCTDAKQYKQKILKPGLEIKALPIPRGPLDAFFTEIKQAIELSPGEYATR